MKKIILALLFLTVAAWSVFMLDPRSFPNLLAILLLTSIFLISLGVRKPAASQPEPAEKSDPYVAPSVPVAAPGSAGRPIGDVQLFLEDIKARGFMPRGILDVGANRGSWTQMALSVFPTAQSVMIEPQDEVESFLKDLVSSDARCQYFKVGVGREAGELVQTLWEDTYGSSFAVPPDQELLKSGKQRITIIRTIDDILKELSDKFAPDLVKIDIQGFELEALSGALNLFGKTEVFVLETTLLSSNPIWPETRKVIEFMAEKGYEIYDITSYLRKPSDGSLGQVDFAFVKDKGTFRQNLEW